VRFSRLAGLTTAGLLALTVAAPAGAADDAHIRVLHGSPDAPSVDVFANDGKVDDLSGLEFGDLSEYVAVPGDTYSIKVCATADSTVCPIGPIDLEFEAGKKYTIAASDLLAQIKADVFTDGNGAAGTAKARVVHLSADTPDVDVLTQDGSATVVEGVAYRSATDYLELPADDYDLKVCAAADNSVCPLDPGSLSLENGMAYSVFAIGSLESESLTAVVAVDGAAAPDTATVGTTETVAPTTGVAALLLAAAAALGLVGSLRYATARARVR
jgi:Domain of unknown function (DUF4397)